jgi:hypothetical protein
MNRNTRCHHPPRRARRRPELPSGAAAAAVAGGVKLYAWNFRTFDDVPAIVHTDELWQVVDLKFLRQFGTPLEDRLAAIVADGRICVAARPWFLTNENSMNETGTFTGTIATRRWAGTLLVETRLPRYRSPHAERWPWLLDTVEQLVVATVSGNVA